MDNKETFYITTPIYYVNDVPHLGHLYTTVAADVLARYHRQEGKEVFFLTGTDEHGQKADQAAKKSGQSVQAHVDRHSAVFRSLWETMKMSNDDFIRTTEPRHVQVVQSVLKRLYDEGEIYSDLYEGWYCVPDERFWTEKDLAEGMCPECGRKVDRIREKNYFFRMGKHQQWLIDHIKENEEFIGPPTRRNEVLGFLEKKLGDLCISRPKSRMEWGVELPFDGDYVTYVWFDALLNYVSGVGYMADEVKFEKFWPVDLHLIGKDILTTHAVYWPTMLKAAGLPLPKKIFAHGWWTISGKKMSKSLGNALDPEKVAEQVGLDQFRYFLMKEVPFGLDGDFSTDALITRLNVDLANNLGNLVSRTLKMVAKYRDKNVPSPAGGNDAEEVKSAALGALERYAEQMAKPFFNRALDEVIQLCDVANRFIDAQKPWELAKNEADAGRLDDVLYYSAEVLRLVGRMVMPFMPEAAAVLCHQLGLDNGPGDARWGGLAPGGQVRPGDALFPRIDDKKAQKVRDALPSPQEKKEEENDALLTIDDFKKIDLRTARILSAQPVEKSKKLFKLLVELGNEKRQVVAGIAEHYRPEELVGRQVIMVANLKPAKLMGVESNGMILAAKEGAKLVLLGAWQDTASGLQVS